MATKDCRKNNAEQTERQIKIVVEKYANGHVAYPLGLKGVVVGEGDTYEEALAVVKSAIRFHLETFCPTARIEEVHMMDCLHPMALEDEELLRFALDGEALSAEASRHLEQCINCQERLVSYKSTHTLLVSRLYRSQCPDSTKLSLYCAELLPPDERFNIAQHVQDCPLCATEAADARQFLAVPDRDLLASPPFSLNGFHTIAHRIFATLVKQQAQLVVRSEAAESAWPRQYRADSINLSLHLSRARSGEYLLLGIITDPNESIEAFTGMTAELYPAADGKDANRAKKPLLSEQVDDLGNIAFSAVPVGNYVMIIHLGERELVIEGLDIQPG